MIKLRFVAGYTFVAAAVRAAEYGYGWTHCEAVTAEGNYLGSVYDPTGRQDGVHERIPSYDGITPDDPRNCFVEVPCPAPEEAIFYATARGELGKPYDLVDVMADFANGRDWRNPNAWWCSELMAFCLERALGEHMAVAVEKVSPRDLAIWLSGMLVDVPQYSGTKALLAVAH